MNNIFITVTTKLNTSRLDVIDQILQADIPVVGVQSQFINSYNHVIINYHYYLNTRSYNESHFHKVSTKNETVRVQCADYHFDFPVVILYHCDHTVCSHSLSIQYSVLSS